MIYLCSVWGRLWLPVSEQRQYSNSFNGSWGLAFIWIKAHSTLPVIIDLLTSISVCARKLYLIFEVQMCNGIDFFLSQVQAHKMFFSLPLTMCPTIVHTCFYQAFLRKFTEPSEQILLLCVFFVVWKLGSQNDLK